MVLYGFRRQFALFWPFRALFLGVFVRLKDGGCTVRGPLHARFWFRTLPVTTAFGVSSKVGRSRAYLGFARVNWERELRAKNCHTRRQKMGGKKRKHARFWAILVAIWTFSARLKSTPCAHGRPLSDRFGFGSLPSSMALDAPHDCE